jgi:protein-serine/threonine kinase
MYGASEIKQHPYFDNVNWDTMRQMQAPFQPQLSSEIDTEYFPIDDIDQTDHTAAWQQQAQDLIENHEAEMTLPFIGYTYKRFDAYKPS